jgi:mRNA interferase MazF
MVLTPRSYHAKSGRSIVCPISSKGQGWPWNVALPSGMKTKGVVLVDQVRTIDRLRIFDATETAPDEVVGEVLGQLATLLGINPSALELA